MRFLTLARKPMILVIALAALLPLSASHTALATGSSIGPSPAWLYFMQGAWNDSGSTLTADVDATANHIPITDDTVLLAGSVVRVDSEYMLIQRFEDNGYGMPPYEMVVARGWYGSAKISHGSGTMIRAQTVTADIWANDISDAWGLGAFSVSVTLPPQLHYVKLVPEWAWLTGTGRTLANCDGFHADGSSTWYVSCATTGNPGDSGHPLGRKGSGLIATLTLQVGQDMGTSVVTIDGELANTTGADIAATKKNLSVRVLACPDANLDGKVDSGDLGQIAKNMSDHGEDSGATLAADINASQTSIPISNGPGLLVNGDIISVGTEIMTAVTVQSDHIMVTRGTYSTPVASHSASTAIFRGTLDGNHDGKLGYTDPRDVNDDGRVDSGDYGTVAKTMVTRCSGE